MRYVDPFYWFLRFVLSFFFKADLSKDDKSFVESNGWKHRKILWLNALAGCLSWYGIAQVSPTNLGTLATGLVAPVMVMGGAWFAISFGGIPARLIDIAMTITFWLFLAFTLSLTVMMLMIMSITPLIIWPVLGTIHLGAIISCVQYDTTDGLKAGLDEAVLNHSRAALMHYKSEGIDPDKET